MRASAHHPPLRQLIERVGTRVETAWYTLSDDHRDWLVRHRRRLLWWTAFAGGLVAPWLLVPLAVAAYLAQTPPRRTTSPILITLCAAIPVMWVRQGAADAAWIDDAGTGGVVASALIAVGVAVCLARLERRLTDGATGVRPLLPQLRHSLNPAAYGIPPFRILLGFRGRAWVSAAQQVGALVIGPPRSGKTSSVIIPNVMAWPGPAVVTSTRRDVLDTCHDIRTKRGTVWCFDPVGTVATTMPSTVRRLDWSPLRGAEDFDIALARARALLAGSVEGTEGRDHWRARGTQLLGALLHAGAQAQLPMSRVVEWVHGGRLDGAHHVVTETNARRAAAVLDGIEQTPDRERGSIWSAVAGALAPFDDSTVLASADRASTCAFTTADFLRRPDTKPAR